jgi:hypothetical protein
MSHLVFFLEEQSAKAMLESFLPRVVPAETVMRFIVFEGKQDLEKNLTRKIRGYLVPGARFIVVRDQDSGDCRAIKGRLAACCAAAGKSDAVVRIACRELESWYIADFKAVAAAYGKPTLLRERGSAKYRNPDQVESPSRELARLVPEYQKIDGSRRIGRFLDPGNQTSSSFHQFVVSVLRAV